MSTNDPLTAAILAAGKELSDEHMWSLGDDGEREADPDGVFVSVLHKHVAPLIGEGYLEVRRQWLQMELSNVESAIAKAQGETC